MVTAAVRVAAVAARVATTVTEAVVAAEVVRQEMLVAVMVARVASVKAKEEERAVKDISDASSDGACISEGCGSENIGKSGDVN